MRFLAPIFADVADRAISRVLRNLDQRIREIVGVPIIAGRLIRDVSITSTGTDIIHGLERTPVGAIACKGESTTSVFSFYDFTRTQITAKSSSGTQTVSIWIF